MFKYVDFKKEHLIDFEYTGIESLPENFQEHFVNMFGNSEEIHTLIADGVVFGFIGYLELNASTVQVWAFFNTEIHKISIQKFLRSVFCRELKRLLKTYDRIQTFCLNDLKKVNNFIQWFKFKKEAVLKRFSNNQDYAIYVLFRGDL
jgi:hypothetical protein